ncbi:MAG: VanZ family protein [Muribaculaceae bacterium]|nr:VanZ family protein [Muribaculaceae bacterium]
MPAPHRVYTITRKLSHLPGGIFSVVSLLIILWLTLSPDPLGDNSPRLFPGADKVAHALMFGFLTAMILLDRTRKRDWLPVSIPPVMFAVAVSTAIGCLIEVLQLKMALGRGFEYSDMIADFAGALLTGNGWLLLMNPFLRDLHKDN